MAQELRESRRSDLIRGEGPAGPQRPADEPDLRGVPTWAR